MVHSDFFFSSITLIQSMSRASYLCHCINQHHNGVDPWQSAAVFVFQNFVIYELKAGHDAQYIFCATRVQ